MLGLDSRLTDVEQAVNVLEGSIIPNILSQLHDVEGAVNNYDNTDISGRIDEVEGSAEEALSDAAANAEKIDDVTTTADDALSATETNAEAIEEVSTTITDLEVGLKKIVGRTSDVENAVGVMNMRFVRHTDCMTDAWKCGVDKRLTRIEELLQTLTETVSGKSKRKRANVES